MSSEHYLSYTYTNTFGTLVTKGLSLSNLGENIFSYLASQHNYGRLYVKSVTLMVWNTNGTTTTFLWQNA